MREDASRTSSLSTKWLGSDVSGVLPRVAEQQRNPIHENGNNYRWNNHTLDVSAAVETDDVDPQRLAGSSTLNLAFDFFAVTTYELERCDENVSTDVRVNDAALRLGGGIIMLQREVKKRRIEY